MKVTKVSSQQRTLNILNKAAELGFELDGNDTIDTALAKASDYLIENDEAAEEECEVETAGVNSQRVDWCDAHGYEYWAQGEIVDFSAHWRMTPETKVYHSTVIDSIGNVVKLYYLVGETEYNAPEGFYYDEKKAAHVPNEE